MDRARQPGSTGRLPAAKAALAATERRGQNILGARVKIERNKVGGWLALNGQFLSRCNFGVQSARRLLRDLALDRKQVIQIAIVLFGPDVGIRARVDQLGIHMKPVAVLRTLPSRT